MGVEPAVSVLIPAYRATETIQRAVQSVFAAGLPAERVEIIVASDDAEDYAPLLAGYPSLVFTAPGPKRTGAAPARNRALAMARGTYILPLDADDTLAPGYLDALLTLAARHEIVCSPTSVIKDEREILRLPLTETLSMEDFGRYGASFRPFARREGYGDFLQRPAEDVIHALELLSRVGGSAPLTRIPYEARLTTGSVTRDPDFAARADAAYATYVAEIHAGATRVPPALYARASAVFEAKRDLNRRFMAQTAEPTFYDFIATEIVGGESPEVEGWSG